MKRDSVYFKILSIRKVWQLNLVTTKKSVDYGLKKLKIINIKLYANISINDIIK